MHRPTLSHPSHARTASGNWKCKTNFNFLNWKIFQLTETSTHPFTHTTFNSAHITAHKENKVSWTTPQDFHSISISIRFGQKKRKMTRTYKNKRFIVIKIIIMMCEWWIFVDDVNNYLKLYVNHQKAKNCFTTHVP